MYASTPLMVLLLLMVVEFKSGEAVRERIALMGVNEQIRSANCRNAFTTRTIIKTFRSFTLAKSFPYVAPRRPRANIASWAR